LSLALVAARVLLGLEALGLIGIAVAFAYFQLAIALWAASDTHDMGILWQGVWIGLAVVDVGLILGGAPLALTFARRRWAYFGLLGIELLLVLVFILYFTLDALQPLPVVSRPRSRSGEQSCCCSSCCRALSACFCSFALREQFSL